MGKPADKPKGDQYADFASLAAAQVHGRDYSIRVLRRAQSNVAILAPHGGSIERRTSQIARAVAGGDFALYLFEGLDDDGSYDSLHITSHRFDEPNCLELIADMDTVVAIHGCSGTQPRILLGGLDETLIAALAARLLIPGLDVLTSDHAFPGRHPLNICNRGRHGRGVQMELSDGLRGTQDEARVIEAIRAELLNVDRAGRHTSVLQPSDRTEPDT